MTEGSRELLPCPFCGETPRRDEVSPDGCTIYCWKCAIELSLREWNTRVSRTAPDGGRDAVDVVATPADREAAADYGRALGSVSPGEAEAIKRGEWDDLPRVQWFARHRRAAISSLATIRAGVVEECARVAEQWVPPIGSVHHVGPTTANEACPAIAAAIRALADGEKSGG